MPINTFDNTTGTDYLEALRLEQAKNKAANLSNRKLTPSYILSIDEALAFTDSVPAPISATPNSYQVTADDTNQELFLLLDQDILEGSGNSNTATVSGTETYIAGPEPSPDKFLYAFDFNGSTQITIANESNFDKERTAAWSCSFWAKWTTGSAMIFISKMTATANTGFEIGCGATGTIRIRLINTATTNEIDVVTTATYKDGIWRHFCITKSTASTASGVKLYVNGSSVSLTTTTDNLNATMLNNIALTLAGYNGGTGDFTGQLCDVQFFNIELTSAQALSLSEGKQYSANANAGFLSLSDVSV